MAIKNIVATAINLNASPLASGIDVYGTSMFRGNVAVQGTLLASGIAATGSVVSASNVGAGAGVFKQLSVGDLQFKSLVTGNTNLALTSQTNDIKFDIGNSGLDVANQAIFRGNLIVQGTLVASGVGVGGGGSVSSASNVGGGIGFFNQLAGSDLQFKTLVSANANTAVTSGLTINTITTGNSGLDVNGNSVLRGTLNLQRAVTSGLDVYGNTTLRDNLNVIGNLTVKNKIDTSGSALLAGNAGVVQWSVQRLDDSLALKSVDWTNRYLYYTNGSSIVLDWNAQFLRDVTGEVALGWGNRYTADSSGNLSIDWDNRLLRDSGGFDTVDWENNLLADAAGNTTVNWGSRTLVGSWLADSTFKAASGLDVYNQSIFRGNLIVQGTLVASGVGSGGSGTITSASNVGGGVGFFNQVVGANLQFKTLVGTNNNTIVNSGLTVNTVSTGYSGLDVTGTTLLRGPLVTQDVLIASGVGVGGNSGLDIYGNVTIRGTLTHQGRLTGQAIPVLSGAGLFSTNRNASDSFIIDMTGNLILNPPTNGIEGDRVKWKLIADGANRAVTLVSGVSSNFAIPSSSTLVSPFTVSASTMTVLMVEKFGTRWLVESYIPGY